MSIDTAPSPEQYDSPKEKKTRVPRRKVEMFNSESAGPAPVTAAQREAIRQEYRDELAAERLKPIPVKVRPPEVFLEKDTRLIGNTDFLRVTKALRLILRLMKRITPDEKGPGMKEHPWSSHAMIGQAIELIDGIVLFED